jgi:hypothetical protein
MTAQYAALRRTNTKPTCQVDGMDRLCCLPLHHSLAQKISCSRRRAAGGSRHLGRGLDAVADVEVGEGGNGTLAFCRKMAGSDGSSGGLGRSARY